MKTKRESFSGDVTVVLTALQLLAFTGIRASRGSERGDALRLMQIRRHFHSDLVLLKGAREVFPELAGVKDKYLRHAHDGVSRREIGILIYIHLTYPDPALDFSGKAIDHRHECPAGRTPRGPGKEKNRQRGPKHLFLEIRFRKNHRLGGEEFFRLQRPFAFAAYRSFIDLCRRDLVLCPAFRAAKQIGTLFLSACPIQQ